MSSNDDQNLARLQAQNEQLNEQVRLLVRTEQRLHRYQAEIDRQLERIHALNQFGLEAARSAGTEDILRLAARALLQLVPSDFTLAYRATGANDHTQLVLVGRVGRKAKDDDQASIDVPTASLARELVVVFDDAEPGPHAALLETLSEEARAPSTDKGMWVLLLIAAPDRAALGLLALRKDDRRALGHQRLPTEEDEPFLMLLAAHVEAAISNASLRQHLENAVADRTRELERANRDLRVLHVAIESVADAIEVRGSDGRYQYVNPAFESLTGYARDDVLGETPEELFGDRHEHPREVAQTLALGRSWVGEVSGQRKDGSGFQHDVTISPVHDDETGMTNVVAVRRDVTARRQLENQLRLSEHMASVGRLAAGVAHEINNPLAYVSLNLGHLRETLVESAGGSGAGQDTRSALDAAQEGADRVGSIVRDLMTFSRVDHGESGVSDVAPVVHGASRMAGNEIRHKAKLIMDLGNTPPVSANPSRLSQVVLNLLINAAHAIEEGAADKNEIRVTTRHTASGDVTIQVSDTGSGMSAEAARQAFDPFFTTKAIGEGTGLGLSICHAIVTGMGGGISVDSEPGKGTSFVVRLAVAKRSVRSDVAPPSSRRVAGHRARLLVIDDEPQVGRALQRLLRRHDVEAVTSATEGLSRCLETPYDLVLCDLMMPEMTGPDFYEQLAKQSPGAENRVVFITGGAFTPKAQEFLDRIPARWFSKPFDAVALAKFVDNFVATTDGPPSSSM